MRFPEWLYKLLSGDEGSQQLGIIWREASSSQAAVTVGQTVYQVPPDKCLVLTNMSGQFTPGAGQTCDRRRFMADPPEGTVRYTFMEFETNGGAGVAIDMNWQGEVVIPGGWKVRNEAVFSAGAVANGINAELHGYLIPRGTFVF